MKSKQLFLKTAIITSVFILTLNTSCKKDTVENPPDNIDTIAININETSIRPYQIVTVAITGTDLLYEDYNGIIGTEEIILKRASENELVLMVPNLSPGTYSLSLTFDNSNTASTNVVILENTTIDDYNLIISTVESEIINTLDYAQAIAAETGNSLANEEVDLLTNMINSFNDTYSQLNENEKLAYAHFINENPDLFEPGDKNKVKSDNQAVINYKEFLLKKVFTIGTSGTVLGLSITAPSPDILTKIIAITAAIILVRELKAVAYKTIEFYDIAHIPFISSLVGSSKNTDFIFTNDNEYTFDINVNLRSVYNADIGTNNSTLSSIILHLDTFQYWWGKIDGFILTIKNVFGFSGGGLTGRPQTISDIST
ncbi:MAG TPA: hypothetical protein PKN32_05050, partial [Bacteroidales bacterium]|nr:hypothetical protein [Bacteroidales bacterium]